MASRPLPPRLPLLLVLALLLAGCAGPQAALRSMVLATTTSVNDSGMLGALLPPFEQAHGVQVKVVAVGTGRALELGRTGDADVVLVHAPATERAYLANGSYVRRYEFAYDAFLIVGPPSDPAGVARAGNASEAFARIARNGSAFVSRGDGSGTHLKEQQLWAAAGYDYGAQVAVPQNAWYKSVGQGMGATLRVADQEQAYCLTDDGTYYNLQPDLAVLRGNDTSLRNQYSVLLINATRAPGVKADLAQAFADYLVGPDGQQRIAAYDIKGHHIYTADAGVVEPR